MKRKINQTIQEFVNLAVENGAIQELDQLYLRNQLLNFLGLHNWEEPENHVEEQAADSLELMDELLVSAQENGAIPENGLAFYEAALMDFITPKPSQLNRDFWRDYQWSPKQATDSFYALAKQVNQVKTREIARNLVFNYASKYGPLEITINLSKPEKDPKDIAAAKLAPTSSYPRCPLCMENEGFYGFANQAARSNHRIIRLELNGEKWGFQYSPYAYYNEHAIILNEKHQAMKIDQRCFKNLLAFVDQFPHYMIGSNADLPIVGGSILSHDHYQAGRHEFPMMKAGLRSEIKLKKFPEITAGLVNWPMTVIRLIGADKDKIVAASDHILQGWQNYQDQKLEIVAHTADGIQHHTITPIVYRRGENYEMNLVLRDNNVSTAFPDGIFHPHPEWHHIKKENIGLIEVMGLAILPARLKTELAEVEKHLLNQPNQLAEKHRSWAESISLSENITPENSEAKIQKAVGRVFTRVLQDAGVFKETTDGQAGFLRFVAFLNQS